MPTVITVLFAISVCQRINNWLYSLISSSWFLQPFVQPAKGCLGFLSQFCVRGTGGQSLQSRSGFRRTDVLKDLNRPQAAKLLRVQHRTIEFLQELLGTPTRFQR